MHSDFNRGRTHATVSSATNSVKDIRSGQKRGIAWTAPQRHKLLPDLPTMREQGLPEFEVSSLMGFWVTGGTPAPIVNKLSAALVQAAKDPDIAAKLAPSGTDMVGSSAAQFREVVVTEIDRWRALLKEAGVAPIPL
jgi:tripartite-type tricarboxylate transporter receptor subunit TctC